MIVATSNMSRLLGFGHIMSVVGTQTLIANRGDPDRRDARFGVSPLMAAADSAAILNCHVTGG